MLKKSKCFIIFINICHPLLSLCVAENQYPDVIATFRGPFQDPPMTLQVEKFYEENISCDLMMEPMETIRTALNQLEVLRRSYCSNPSVSEREPINLPILSTGSRSSGISNLDKNNDNEGIDLATNEDYPIKTTENPSILSTTIEDNISTTSQETFFKKAKKKCPPKKMAPKSLQSPRPGRKNVPYSFYEFSDDHENHDEYYEHAYYYNDIKK